MAGRRSSGGGKRSSRANKSSARHYPRTARLNALLSEIVGDYFERTDSDGLGFLTVTGVEIDSDLNLAEVFVSVFGSTVEEDAETLELLFDEHRLPLKRVIAQEAKLRKTPEVEFKFDPAVRTGAKIEEILAGLGLGGEDEDAEDGEDGASEPGSDLSEEE